MTTNRIVLFIFGVLAVIGGIYCAATPGLTYLSMIWVIGFAILFHGIEDIMTWSARKKLGLADGWSLFGSIVAVLCGLTVVISGQAQLLTGLTLLYFLFGWIIFAGVLGIISAFRLKGLKKSEVPEIMAIGSKWGWILLFGILMVIAGLFGFAHPLLSAVSIGIIVGVNIIITGINMILRAFTL